MGLQDKWAHPPFSAHTDAQGNIYARGAQDMKCVGIQYLEAIRRMRLAGASVRRTVHVAFMPGGTPPCAHLAFKRSVFR